jgi:hypothetical protein
MTDHSDNLPVAAATQRFTEVAARNEGGVFSSPQAFEHGQRMARALAASSMVPAQYRDNLPNVLVALDVAMRAKLPPMMVLQGLNVIQGRPSWSAQFIVAAINGCGLFGPLRYEMKGTEGADDWGCRAVSVELSTGLELQGPWVSVAMAKKEGWFGRTGSKWQTMPEIMLRWRAASFFGRLYAAHILAGMASTDELRDAGEIDVTPARAAEVAPTGGDPLAMLNERTAPAAAPGAEPPRRRGRPPKAATPAEPAPAADPAPAVAPEPAAAVPAAAAAVPPPVIEPAPFVPPVPAPVDPFAAGPNDGPGFGVAEAPF